MVSIFENLVIVILKHTFAAYFFLIFASQCYFVIKPSKTMTMGLWCYMGTITLQPKSKNI